ncbi:hypothetical protein [Haloplanus halophilus]|uniref:hypothetical protein n=1 Tax=Haloplanus halophilus TaxID=2949993 RepID=UPI00203FEF3D|nr:hypothetical protein [Haloplanus sp. GDY1]
MDVDPRSHADGESERDQPSGPEIAVCEGGPETAVFLESGNTDGWIASDVTVDVRR